MAEVGEDRCDGLGIQRGVLGGHVGAGGKRALAVAVYRTLVRDRSHRRPALPAEVADQVRERLWQWGSRAARQRLEDVVTAPAEPLRPLERVQGYPVDGRATPRLDVGECPEVRILAVGSDPRKVAAAVRAGAETPVTTASATPIWAYHGGV